MKKYLAFAGSNYYPVGGMNDFIGSFEILEDAINKINEYDDSYGRLNDWGHVLSLDSMQIVYELK